MDTVPEPQDIEGVVEAGSEQASIAYTVEIRVVNDSYCPAQDDMQEQRLDLVTNDMPPSGEPPIEVMAESVDAMGVEQRNPHHHTAVSAEQIEPGNMLVAFSDSGPHHITVTDDMVGYLPAEGAVAQSVNPASSGPHQIIVAQTTPGATEGMPEVKLVEGMAADQSHDQSSVILVQSDDPGPAGQEVHTVVEGHPHQADQHQPDTIKEMEIASAVEALEALTGLASTFNAWAQQNPQVLSNAGLSEDALEPSADKPKKDKSAKHKTKHKAKKHKSGKHKKKSSHKREKPSPSTGDIDSNSVENCKCKLCGKIFGSRLKLKNHMISHSDERPFSCDVCGCAFKRARYLQIHKKSHFSDTLFACQYCDKAYFERKRLRSHEKCHVNPFTCEVCGKAYGDKRGMMIHFRSHTNERPFVCRICGRAFTSKAGVSKHERSHSGLKPYVCKVCGKAYTQPTNLSDHQRTHLDERTFACTSCPKVFLARSSLRRHRVKNHPGEKPNVGRLDPLHTRQRIFRRVTPMDIKASYRFPCNLCNKKFKKEKYLKKHSKTHTEGTRACTFCSKSFRDKRDLLNHERRHTGEKPFKCSKCTKAFVSSSAMLRHEKCHLGLRPYVCSVCNKGFTRTTGLRDHELIHKGTSKRFPCNYNCDKIFASRSALRSHERLKHQPQQQQPQQQQQQQQFAAVGDAPIASMEVPVETCDEGDTVSYIKLMFTEA